VFGHIFFLLPLTIIMLVMGIPFLLRSARLNEQSLNAGGLPQWPAKSLIVIGFALLFLQVISELIKRIAIMRGVIADTARGPQHAAEAEAERVLAAARAESR
jgi:TRAP-type mannitol/chloroaromatic compound transport system permease small subunit